jgi:FkbH-like protein
MNTKTANSMLEHKSYFEIIKTGSNHSPQELRTVRVAFLADCSLQHLSRILSILGRERGFNIEIYEGDFDNIEMEAIDENSKLYAFNPEFVFIIQQTQKLKNRLYDINNPEVVNQSVESIAVIWDTIRKKLNIPIIQSTFVMPPERAFGNYELMVPNSLSSRIREVNDRIVEEARLRKDILINDIDYLSSEFGRKNWIDEKLWLMAKAPCALEAMPILAKNILDIILAGTGKIVKCVILDLDNTLWGGIIGDDGLEGIRLGDYEDGYAFSQLQLFALTLKNRGIILAVCSKNDVNNALKPFNEHPDMVLKESDISVFIANWQDKASNIKAIQEILNIGFDSMVFLDDNPFERNLVRGILPDVIVPELPEDPESYVRYLSSLNLFESTTFSALDIDRAEMYKVEAQRTQLKANFDSVDEYLISLDMEIIEERFNSFNLPRIAQLIQRSNQFNLTTRRYSESECFELSTNDLNYYPFTLSLLDKFGSYGLICVSILKFESSEIYIDEYLMSCRVLQRGVEHYAMNRIFEIAHDKGASRVVGEYLPTSKNAMVKGFYEKFGFECIEERTDGSSKWALAVDVYSKRKCLMKATIETGNK